MSIDDDILAFVQTKDLRYIPTAKGITAKVSFEQWQGEHFQSSEGYQLAEEAILAAGQTARRRLGQELQAARNALLQVAPPVVNVQVVNVSDPGDVEAAIREPF